MRKWLPILLWMIPSLVAAADPNEGPIVKFMTTWFPEISNGVITLEPREIGPGFALYYAHQSQKDAKGGDQQPLIYVSGTRQIVVGDYFSLDKFKDQDIDPKFVASFLSTAIGATFKAVPPGEKSDPREINLDQETGYGKTRFHAYLYGKIHLMIGQRFSVDADARQIRMKNINTKMGGSLGDPSAPHRLYVFLDLECPHCARLEKDLLPLLKDRKDWQSVFFLFPLTLGHPISFKASAAACCFKAEDPKLYFDFINWFYPQQADLDSTSVDTACYGFAQMHNLEDKFLGCYMQPANIREILDTLQMEADAGVHYTPALYLDGTAYLPGDLINLLKPAAPEAKAESAEPKAPPKAQAPTP